MKFGKFFYDEVNELEFDIQKYQYQKSKGIFNLCDEALKAVKKQNIILRKWW